MTKAIEYKEKIIQVYKSYETYFQILFKFLVAFFVFGYINDNLGYYAVLNNLGIQVLLSLISAIIPSSVFVLLAAIVSLIHLYRLSLVMMLLAFVVFVVFYFLYLKFAPTHGVLMMVLVVLMPLNLHFVVPLIAGLFFTPFTIVPVACSFIVASFVRYIVEAAPMVEDVGTDLEAIVAAYQYVIDHVLENHTMLLYAGVFAVMIVVTYVISRLPFDYSWYIAIGAGTLVGIIGMIVGAGIVDVQISVGGTFLGCVISGLFVAVVQFLRCSVDYNRKEFVQFEDDDYYYYVRAIPKMGVSLHHSEKKAAPQQPAASRSEKRVRGKGEKDFKDSLKGIFSRHMDDDDVFEEDFSRSDDIPDVTVPKEEEGDSFGDSSKESEIIIPQIKVPQRTVVPKSAVLKNGSSKPEVSKSVSPAQPKTEKKSFDFDFDDGYDDSVEDYSSDDSDF